MDEDIRNLSSRTSNIAPTIRDSFQLPDGTGRPSLMSRAPGDDVDDTMEGVYIRSMNGGGSSRQQQHNDWTNVDERSWTDRFGNIYFFQNNPLLTACPFVLILECCERLSYYSIAPTLKPFLKHTLGKNDAQASSLAEYWAAAIYIPSFLSAILSDTFTGSYLTIVIFSTIYAIGLALLVAAASPTIGAEWLVYLSLFVFVVIGAGGIKSCVNVFGAQQMHPILQTKSVQRFFTYFCASINIGALLGGLSAPQVAASASFFYAYMIPLGGFAIAFIVFFAASKQFVKIKPQGSPVVSVGRVLFHTARRCSFQKVKQSNGGPLDDLLVDDTLGLIRLLPVCSMVIPLMMAYNQMITAFLTQGEKMDSSIFGLKFTPALMMNLVPLGVILSTLFLDWLVFPFLRRRDWMPNVMVKFFIGNLLAVVSLLCAFFVELGVMAQDKPNTMSIWWQMPQFFIIAPAEIFSLATSFEVAFTLAPASLKTVSSACNLIFFSIAGFISGFLFVICEGWMPDFKPNEPSSYKDAHYDYYYLVLVGVCVVGCVLCFVLMPYFKWATMKRQRHIIAESAAGGGTTIAAEDDNANATEFDSDCDLVRASASLSASQRPAVAVSDGIVLDERTLLSEGR